MVKFQFLGLEGHCRPKLFQEWCVFHVDGMLTSTEGRISLMWTARTGERECQKPLQVYHNIMRTKLFSKYMPRSHTQLVYCPTAAYSACSPKLCFNAIVTADAIAATGAI